MERPLKLLIDSFCVYAELVVVQLQLSYILSLSSTVYQSNISNTCTVNSVCSPKLCRIHNAVYVISLHVLLITCFLYHQNLALFTGLTTSEEVSVTTATESDQSSKTSTGLYLQKNIMEIQCQLGNHIMALAWL